MNAATVGVLLGVAGVIWWLVFAVVGTARKDKWGINVRRVSCPSCDEPMPLIRIPSSMEQAILGGWTCPKCRCEIDKWGRKIASGTSDKAGNR